MPKLSQIAAAAIMTRWADFMPSHLGLSFPAIDGIDFEIITALGGKQTRNDELEETTFTFPDGSELKADTSFLQTDGSVSGFSDF